MVREIDQITRGQISELWYNFLRSFKKNNQEIILKSEGHGNSNDGYYVNIIADMPRDNSTTLIINYDDIHEYIDLRGGSETLLPLLQVMEDPDQAIQTLLLAFDRVMLETAPDYIHQPDVKNNLRVGFRNTPWYLEIPNVNHDLVNTFVAVDGFVTKVDEHPRHIFIRTALSCDNCDAITEVEGPVVAGKKYKCINCREILGVSVSLKDSVRNTYQEIVIQQRPDSTKEGRIAVDMTVRIIGKDMINVVKGGDYVKVCGIVRIDLDTAQYYQKKKNKHALSEFYIEASSIEIQPEDMMLERDPALEEAVKEAVKPESEEEDFERLHRSVCPSIRGHKADKLATLLLMAGAIAKRNKIDGTRHRGDINLLLVGDKSTSKTTTATWVMQVMPRAVFNSGKGSSAAGLIAGVNFKDGVARLEAGAYLMAAGGVLVADEVSSIPTDVLEQLKELMDDRQTMTIRKGGIHKQMPVRCASLHMCNPKGGIWDDTKGFLENVGMEAPLASRYDLIFVFRDIPDEKTDEANYEHFSKSYGNSVFEDEYDSLRRKEKGSFVAANKQMTRKQESYSTAFMAHWVRYIRAAFRPKIETGSIADKTIKKGYLTLRGYDVSSMSDTDIARKISIVGIRQIGALYRLSEASARAHHRNIVTQKDAALAIELLQASIASSGFNMILSGESGKKNNTYSNNGRGQGLVQEFSPFDTRIDKEFEQAKNQFMSIFKKHAASICHRCKDGKEESHGMWVNCTTCRGDKSRRVFNETFSRATFLEDCRLARLDTQYVDHFWNELENKGIIMYTGRLNGFKLTPQGFEQVYAPDNPKGHNIIFSPLITEEVKQEILNAERMMAQVKQRHNIQD